MSDTEEDISPEEKANIAQDFIVHSPPGEVEIVCKDVRVLLDDDDSYAEGMLSALSKFRQAQFTPVEVNGNQVLVTQYGLVDPSAKRFIDPRSKSTFVYNFSSQQVSDIKSLEDEEMDDSMEVYRSEIDEAVRAYVEDYFQTGVVTVYSRENSVIVCIEAHKYSPDNFWNGKWRSEYNVKIEGGEAKLTGLLKTQVHYYEDGNVQLVNSKECKEILPISTEKQLAEDIAKLLQKFEYDYQLAMITNYQSMSSGTFKALRRQLPVTRSKIDWNKILAYQIGQDIGAGKN